MESWFENALTKDFNFVYDGIHLSDPNEIDFLDGFDLKSLYQLDNTSIAAGRSSRDYYEIQEAALLSSST